MQFSLPTNVSLLLNPSRLSFHHPLYFTICNSISLSLLLCFFLPYRTFLNIFLFVFILSFSFPKNIGIIKLYNNNNSNIYWLQYMKIVIYCRYYLDVNFKLYERKAGYYELHSQLV